MSFLEKLRQPSFLGPTTSTFDPDESFIQTMRGRTSPGGIRVERGTNPLARMANPMNQMRAELPPRIPGGNADGSPNVVYDAGTELAFKKFDEDKRQNRVNESLREKQIDATSGLRNADLGIKQGNLDIKSQQLQLQRFKAENPNLIIKQVPGGNFVAINPQDGSVVDTGINSGRMNEEDRIGMEQSGRREIEGMRQSGSADRLQSAHQNALERLLLGGDVNIQRDNNRFFNRPDKAPSGNDMTARALAVLEQNPQWAPYIDIDESGKVTVKRPGSGSGLSLIDRLKGTLGYENKAEEGNAPELNQQEWQKINLALYAPKKTGIENQPFVKKAEEESKAGLDLQNNQFTDMIAPDGRKIRVPSSRVQEMISKGAKVQ